jgi:GNAT superfamily N-acetyltransferase
MVPAIQGCCLTRTQPIAPPQPRLLTSADLSAALDLSIIAGWNQTLEDWRMLLELAPQTCFGIEQDRRLVSTATLVCYGLRLAWIGMVLTHPEYRGRGFAHALVTHTLDYADGFGIETVKLDATDQGKPIYEALSFAQEQPIERWIRLGTGGIPGGEDRGLAGLSPDLDSEAFGADRTEVLQALARRGPAIQTNGLLCTRAGRSAAYLGPCVAASADAANALISDRLQLSPDVAWVWDLLPANGHAVEIAVRRGFKRQRSLTRMSRGKTLRPREDWVYAIAGFELG